MATATTKKPAPKRAAATKTTTTTKAAPAAEVEKTVEVKEPKKFKPDDLIPCRSCTAGTLLYNGPKSNIPYSWSSEGDVSYVEFQDLLAAMVSRSDYIYDPLFIIEDEELLADPKWTVVAELYEGVFALQDTQAIIDLPVRQFREVFPSLPLGVKNAIKVKVATQLQDGEFDSLSKIKVIDEVCGTDLHCMM